MATGETSRQKMRLDPGPVLPPVPVLHPAPVLMPAPVLQPAPVFTPAPALATGRGTPKHHQTPELISHIPINFSFYGTIMPTERLES